MERESQRGFPRIDYRIFPVVDTGKTPYYLWKMIYTFVLRC